MYKGKKMRVLILLGVLGRFAGVPARAACEPDDITFQLLKRLDVQYRTWHQRIEAQRAILNELLLQHPSNFFLNLQYQQLPQDSGVARKAMIQRFKARADAHPNNLDDLYLYSAALVDEDTPQALERLRKIVAAKPTYPWAHVGLAGIYRSGKFADRPDLRRHLMLYYDACPASLATQPLELAARYAAPEDAARLSAQFRGRLTRETDPVRLRNWVAVWNLEFKAHPVAEHLMVRKQLAADLKRLEQGALSKDMSGLSVLRTGYQLLGDSDALRLFEDRLVSIYPNSEEAKDILTDRWSKEHPHPAPSDAKDKKQAYYRAQLQMLEQQLRGTPKDFACILERFYALVNIEDSAPEQIIAAGEAFRAALRTDSGWVTIPPQQFSLARCYLKKGLRASDVPALVEEGWTTYRKLALAPRGQTEIQTTMMKAEGKRLSRSKSPPPRSSSMLPDN